MAKKKKKGAKIVQFQKKLSPKKYIKLKARSIPVIKTYAHANIFDSGMGNVIVVREKPNGDKVLGNFLLDVWCLGVKDAMFEIFDEDEYNNYMNLVLNHEALELIEVDANYAFNLVYGALEYAEDLGFDPPEDFDVAEYILDTPESLEYIDLEFGFKGKPRFIAGPQDKVEKIIRTLKSKLGEDGFDFVENPFDDFDNELDETDIDVQKIYDILKNGNEVDDYYYYLNTTRIIEDCYGDIGQLKEDFINHPEEMINNIKDFINSIGDSPVEDDEYPDDYIKAVAEKLIIFRNSEFLNEDKFILSFSYEAIQNDYSTMSNRMFLINYGEKKLNGLIKMIFGLPALDIIPKAEKIALIKGLSEKYKEDGLDSFDKDSGFEAFGLMRQIGYLFSLHESEFKINYEDLDYKPFEEYDDDFE